MDVKKELECGECNNIIKEEAETEVKCEVKTEYQECEYSTFLSSVRFIEIRPCFVPTSPIE